LIFLHRVMSDKELVNYNGDFNSEIGEDILKGYAILERYGWTFADEAERRILDGTHELYEIVKNGGELK
ncbi:MAG: hypothetical protein IJW37_02670, partial [Lachnospiraceae bacterium]|nr:hypothetical protein [Lachnospiraceae bacterium]